MKNKKKKKAKNPYRNFWFFIGVAIMAGMLTSVQLMYVLDTF